LPLPEQQRTAILHPMALLIDHPLICRFGGMLMVLGSGMQSPAPAACWPPFEHWSETKCRSTPLVRRLCDAFTASDPVDAATKARNAKGMQTHPASTHPRRVRTRGQAHASLLLRLEADAAYESTHPQKIAHTFIT